MTEFTDAETNFMLQGLFLQRHDVENRLHDDRHTDFEKSLDQAVLDTIDSAIHKLGGAV